MKVLTLTLHYLDNCGSCLQALALQKFLLKHGYETELIDYRPKYLINNNRPFKHFVKKILFGKKMRGHWQVFDEFLTEYRLTEKTYKKYSELKKNPPAADVYLVGSDQVWNRSFPCGRDEAYYLSFVQSGRKMSYAASMGKYPTPEDELREIQKRIWDFSFVSVREKTSAEELKSEQNLIHWVCDPVLLMERAFYDKMAVSVEEDEYVLIYLTEKSELLDKILLAIKEKTDAKIVYVGSFMNRCECDVNYTDVGPREFLGLIKNAKLVIAGSFHATVFSHIFEKNFIILPYKNNARMVQFLEYTGLKNRYLESEKDINTIYSPVDYTLPMQKLKELRQQSSELLIEALEKAE